MPFTTVNPTVLHGLVEAKVLDHVNADEDFTVKTIKDELRDDYPNLWLAQAEIRLIVLDVFAGLIDYTSEMRSYVADDGSTVYATTFFPVPKAGISPVAPAPVSTPPVASQASNFFSVLSSLNKK